MDKYKRTAIEILDLFEDILDKHSIKIPDEDRTGEESEACIYGVTYGNLEEEIISILTYFDEVG